MTARQKKAAQRYVNTMRPLLGLPEWIVNISDKPVENESHVATIFPVWGTKVANLRLSSHFFEFTAEYQREIVVHELLHCVFAVPQHQVEMILTEYLKGKAGELFHDCWSHSMEYAIDGLAVAICPTLPLPVLPK